MNEKSPPQETHEQPDVDIPEKRIPLVPLGCLAPIVYLLLLMLDLFASLPSIGPTNDLVARCMDWLSVVLLFPFSILFATTNLPLLCHLLGCAFWTSMFVLVLFLFKRRRTIRVRSLPRTNSVTRGGRSDYGEVHCATNVKRKRLP